MPLYVLFVLFSLCRRVRENNIIVMIFGYFRIFLYVLQYFFITKRKILGKYRVKTSIFDTILGSSVIHVKIPVMDEEHDGVVMRILSHPPGVRL
jgi:hypothetical protein